MSTEDNKKRDHCIYCLPFLLHTYVWTKFNDNFHLGSYQIFQVGLPKVNNVLLIGDFNIFDKLCKTKHACLMNIFRTGKK